MPRKLKDRAPFPKENEQLRAENPETMPSKPPVKTAAERRKALEAEADRLAIEERVAARDEQAVDSIRKQMNESSEDRVDPKVLAEARQQAALDKAKKQQDAIVQKIADLGLNQAQFLQMLETYPLTETSGRFKGAKNFFKRLAGQPWAGKDTEQLNNLMETYRKSEEVIDAANKEALTKMQEGSKGRPSLSGSGWINRRNTQESASNTTEEEGSNDTKSSESRSFEIAPDEMLISNTALNTAYAELVKTDKKAAKALVESIGAERYAKYGSAEYTEDRSIGRAKGSKGRVLGQAGSSTMQRGSGTTGANPEIAAILAALDTKLAKEEFAKETKLATTSAKAESTPSETPEETISSKPVSKKAERINEQFDQRREQIDREVAWLAAFTSADAKKAYKLLNPDASTQEMKVVTGKTIADTYRSLLTEEAVLEARLKRKGSKEDKARLGAIRTNLQNTKDFAATVTVSLDQDIDALNAQAEAMREVSAQGRKNMQRLAEEDQAEFLNDADVVEIPNIPSKAKSTRSKRKAA